MTDPCKRCENKKGLPILLVRPTAVAIDPAITPQGASALQPNGAVVTALGLKDLKKSRHALRLLREGGYVYVYYPADKPTGQIKPWSAYKVTAKSGLLPDGEFVLGASESACSVKITHPHDLRTLCIPEPDKVKTVWIGFSMNWWSDTIKRDVIKDPAAAGMIKVDTAAGQAASGFGATAESLHTHVAEYSVQSLEHAGVDSATPFTSPVARASWAEAHTLEAVMQKQSAGSGKEMVLAIPDPVGLAADLNGIRMARDKLDKDGLLVADVAWPLMSYQLLEGVKESVAASALVEARNAAYGSTSQKKWNEVKDAPYFKSAGYVWQATGGQAADGSLNGRLQRLDGKAQEKAVARNSAGMAERNWGQIAGEIDDGKRKQWKTQFDARRRAEADRLEPYENDWQDATFALATKAYFKLHFDANDPNKILSATSAGTTYAKESHLIHFPQPLSKAECHKSYLDNILEKPITDEASVALRAMLGNQKSVIELVHGLLIGDWDRANNDMRDKTLDVFKGLVTGQWGAKFGWMKGLVVGLAGGQLMAISAAATQLAVSLKWTDGLKIPDEVATHLKLLPALAVAEQTLVGALRTAAEGGKPSIPVVINFLWTMEEALEYMEKNPFDYSEADRNALKQKRVGSKVTVKRIAMLEAASGNIGLIASEPSQPPVASSRSQGGLTMAQFEEQVKRTNIETYDRATVKNVKAYLSANKELPVIGKEFRTDAGFGVAVMVVQGLGLIWSTRDLLQALGKGGEAELIDKSLSVADGVAGFTGGLLETWAAGHKLQMASQAEGVQLAPASTVLVNLKAGAAMAGVAGGIFNMVMSFRKADKAEEEGDIVASRAYQRAAVAFGMTAGPAAAVAADALTGGAVNRALGSAAQKVAPQRVAAAVARQIAVRLAAGSAIGAAEALTVVVAGAVATIGWVLLVGGVAFTLIGAATERTELQRWVGRSYFGRDKGKRYKNAGEEALYFDLLTGKDYQAMAAQETERLAKQNPAPPASPPAPLGNPMGDAAGGWGSP